MIKDRKSSNISPLYSIKCQRYYAQRPNDEGKIIKNKSFVLLWENDPIIAFCGATIRTNDKIDAHEMRGTKIQQII